MKQSQLTNTLIMISPDQFGFNTETAVTNIFQNSPSKAGLSPQKIRNAAKAEFKGMVNTLRSHGIAVISLPSRKDCITPDAVFPNNWFSHHGDNTLVLYPMLTPNRRAERQLDQLQKALETLQVTPDIFDFTNEENQGNILEGTGSMVLDRVHKVAFAIESTRTTKQLFYTWCTKLGYEPFLFHAYSNEKRIIYHTNMFMSIGDYFTVYCPEAIENKIELTALETKLQQLGKELIPITLDQVYSFCGNILQVVSTTNERKIILSQTAYNAFLPTQRHMLERYGELVPVTIPTIEKIGGGSARCMMAEVFKQ